MKKIFLASACVLSMTAFGQITTPQPSPAAKISQTVGLTEITVDYSRPSKKDRVIFGDLVPFDELWRTGANKNTMITANEELIFGSDTLPAGTYAIFVRPMKDSWNVYFYTNTENWGTPENWDESLVAVKAKATVAATESVTESFTIGFEDLGSNGANLTFAWDKTKATVAFKVNTEKQVMSKIDKVMAGPSASDYYRAAEYYLAEKKDMKQALTWINKSIEMTESPQFWVLRRKSLIQAELGDYKGAIATAKTSLEAAKTAGNNDYVKMNEASIAEWSKKVK